MPTVSVAEDYFLELLHQVYTEEYLDQIMASYGMELDSIVQEPERHSMGLVRTLKIDVCANRGDLLCAENLAKALRCFLGLQLYKQISCKASGLVLTVERQVNDIRPFILSAVVRNVKFTQRAYNSFIDHQDKLHQNVCRRRQLVAIGTHDLSKIDVSSLVYTAKAPENISFIALNQTYRTNGRELFDILRDDKKLSEYLPLIETSPVWPVIYDARNEVLSLPPIINSEYSKISLETRDVFIDTTATDLYKGKIAINAVVSQLLELGGECVETVEVIYESPRKPLTVKYVTSPDTENRSFELDLGRVQSIAGVEIPPANCVEYLSKMQIAATIAADSKKAVCTVPYERADVISEIDLIEDILIGYGYYNIAAKAHYPNTNSIGGTLKSFKVQSIAREELAACGCIETVNFSLCPATDASISALPVALANAKTSTFTHVRTSLIPGMLRAASCAYFRPLPLKIFEVSEVVAPGGDVGVHAISHCGALFGGQTDMFGDLHGALDRLGVRLGKDFQLKAISDGMPWLIDRRKATVWCDGVEVGVIGVVSVDVLKEYKIPFPVSVFDISL